MTSCASKPRSFIHINLPISIISLHLNPRPALSTGFIFLTMPSTPVCPSQFSSLSQYSLLINRQQYQREKVQCHTGIAGTVNISIEMWGTMKVRLKSLWMSKVQRRDYMDGGWKMQWVTSERSEPWSSSTAQLVNHVIAWNCSFVIPKLHKYLLSAEHEKWQQEVCNQKDYAECF